MADIYGNPYGPGASYYDGQWHPPALGVGASSVTPTSTDTMTPEQRFKQALDKVQNSAKSGDQRAYDLALAELMGTFNGQPTLEGQKQQLEQQKLGETQREYNVTTAGNILANAAKLTGPEDYGNYLAYTSGGKRLLQQIQSGRPQSSAPTGDMEPMDLSALMNSLGLGPGQGGQQPKTGGGGSDGLTLIEAMTKRRGVGGGSGTTDYSQFPMSANEGDIAYAKSHAAFDPQQYLDYLSGNGYTPDYQAVTPGFDTYQTAWGLYDPNAPWNSAQHNHSIERRVVAEYFAPQNQRGQGIPLPGNMLPQTTDRVPADIWAQFAGRNLDAVSDPQIEQILGYIRKPVTNNAPGWLGDYINRLISLGPDVNRGAAENLQLLDQLGMANPAGLATLKNPGGNINPVYFDQLSPSGQALLSQAAGKVFGYTPEDFSQQINAQRPLGSPFVPNSVTTMYAPLAA